MKCCTVIKRKELSLLFSSLCVREWRRKGKWGNSTLLPPVSVFCSPVSLAMADGSSDWSFTISIVSPWEPRSHPLETLSDRASSPFQLYFLSKLPFKASPGQISSSGHLIHRKPTASLPSSPSAPHPDASAWEPVSNSDMCQAPVHCVPWFQGRLVLLVIIVFLTYGFCHFCLAFPIVCG